jgi:hypothetical protein
LDEAIIFKNIQHSYYPEFQDNGFLSIYLPFPFSSLVLKALTGLDCPSSRPASKPICILPSPLIPFPASNLPLLQASNQMVFDFPLAASPQYK